MEQTVLIVDDDPDDVMMFCEAIYNVNPSNRCLTAYNGEEGLQSLKDAIKEPDFIFLDLNMPRVNGKEFLMKVKKDSRFAHILVIAFSTSKSEKDAEELQQLGAAIFITKPASYDLLKKTISFILKGEWEKIKYSLK